MDKRVRPYKNRKQTIKRERIIMLVSSAFVMAALTMTGIYMKEKSNQEQNDGYSIDLAEMENNVEDKYAELTDEVQSPIELADNGTKEDTSIAEKPSIIEEAVVDDELDYMPREDSIIGFQVTEVDSGLVEIPGLTDIAEEGLTEEAPELQAQEFTFTEEEGLYVPILNDIMMHYDMDHTVYFATLDQYKYNPAVIFKANEGSEVFACADGKVVDIYRNEEIGQVLVLDLGDGYRATYGQLKDIKVSVGDNVTVGQPIANVSVPTKYYSVEGYNLYFELTKDGVPVNPEGMM